MTSTVDISPELLNKIQNGFQRAFEADPEIKQLYRSVTDGSKTFSDANRFAVRTSEILSDQFRKHLSADVLPDGKFYYNIAQKILSPTLENNYTLISNICQDIQLNIYSNIGLGLQPMTAGVNKSRVNGLAWKASQYDTFDESAWLLAEPIVNFSQNVVDEFIQVNTDFQYDSGLDPKIIRTVVGDCCEWCQNLAGTYDYDEVRETGNNVFRRHERCRCTVDYVLGRRKQNVHTKKWADSTPEQIEARKQA